MQKRNASGFINAGGSRLTRVGETEQHPLAFSDDPVAQMLREALPLNDPRFGVHFLAAAGYTLKQMQSWGVNITREVVEAVVADVVASRVWQTSAEKRPTPTGSVVYYMRLGNRVKIGMSASLVNRVADIQPEELMATEPGGYDIEKLRHQQFAELRVSGEWFRLEDPLTSYIANLAAA